MTEINLNEKSSQEHIKDFEKVSQKGIWLKRFHADWCGHCQNMATEWNKFVSSSSQKEIKIASIEDKAIQKMNQKPNNILGYPSIHLYKDGLFLSEFNGERTSDKINEFLKVYLPKQSGGRLSQKKKKIKSKKNKNQKKKRRNKKNFSRKKL